MAVQVTITGENGLDAAAQVRNFLLGLQLANPLPTEEQAKAGIVAPKAEKAKADKPAPKKPVVDEDDEDDVPAPKKEKKPVVEDDDEDEAPKPKAKAAAAPAPAKKPAKEGKSSVGELVDDGGEQPATTDGCRIMIRRVARAHGQPYAHAVLHEFGLGPNNGGGGASLIPEKKMQKFIDRCQAVIDDASEIELEEAE